MFGHAHCFRRGEEEEKESEHGDADGDDAGLAFAGHFIVTKEAKSQGAEEDDAHTGQGEYTVKDIGHQEADEENRQENEWEIVSDAGAVHAAAHVIQPVRHIKAEEAQRNEGEKHDLIPSVRKTVAVLAEPPEEGTKGEAHSAAKDVVPVSRDKFHNNHRNRGEHRAGSDIGNQLGLGELLFLRDVRFDLRQDFYHEEEEENGHSGEGIQEKGNNNQKDRQEYAHPFENLKLFEIQLSLLGVNGESHKYQVGHHDPHGLHRFSAQIEK